MKNAALLTLCATVVSFAQGTTIPDGTKLRVRLEQTVSSATADEGQTVELSVAEAIKINGETVIADSARVTGTVTQVKERGRMGKAGKLDFSVDRVRAADGEWIPLRYTLNKKTGEGHSTRNGIITAGVAFVFWPAAPFVLLAKGKDITINKGVTFDVFTDADHAFMKANPQAPAPPPVVSASNAPAASAFVPAANVQPAQPTPSDPTSIAAVTVTSPVQGADIEVNGAFVGSTPTTLRLAPGSHAIAVRQGTKVWQRTVQVTPGSTVTINANLSSSAKTISN
jgi:hypothetical protein